MEKRRFGKTDMDLAILGFGGSEIGFGDPPMADIEKLLNSALDIGLNLIDTGECYADSEEKIGKTIAHRRKDYFLFTKVGHASGLPLPDWDLEMLRQSIDRSLERMKTDYLDCIQLHTCGVDTLKQGDVIEVIKRAKEQGKARYIGYSGDNEAAEYAVECGEFDSLQISLSIADQKNLDKVLPEAHKLQMGVIAKRPISNVAWLENGEPDKEDYGYPYWQRFQKLQYPMQKLPAAEAAAIALRFTLSQPGVTCANVGTAKPGRWETNAAALEAGPLSPEEIQAFRRRWNEVKEPDWDTKS